MKVDHSQAGSKVTAAEQFGALNATECDQVIWLDAGQRRKRLI
jgi:hypothetical protein